MSGKTTTVTNAANLIKAFKSAQAGDTILLAPGNYGDVSLSGLKASGTVTIRSADQNNDAVFKTLRLTHVSNIVVDDIDVINPIAPGGPRSAAVAVTKATDVSLIGIDVRGSMNNFTGDDAHGLTIIDSDNVAVLDSQFRQLDTAISIGRSSDVIIAGNTITDSREGVNISTLAGGLFERNLITNMAAQPGDHSDAFQVHAAGLGVGSSDLAFRDNVIFQGTGTNMHGIFMRSERVAEGIRHTDITIENNFYNGAARHGVSVSNADNVLISNNTALYSGKAGLVPAVMVADVRRALVEDNVATLILQNSRLASTDLTIRNNIDVWDIKQLKGVSLDSLFGSTDNAAVDFGKLSPLAGSLAELSGAGFRAVGPIGDLAGSSAALIAAYTPLFEATHSANFIA